MPFLHFFPCSLHYDFSVVAASTAGHWWCQNGIFHLRVQEVRWWPSALNPYLQNQPRDTGQTPSDPSVQLCCQRNWKRGGHSFLTLLCASAPSTSIAVWQSRAALWGEDGDQRWTLQCRSSLKLWIRQCETAKPAGMASLITDIWLDCAAFQFSGMLYCRKWDIRGGIGICFSESSTCCYNCSSSHSDTPCSANLAAEFPE